MSVVNGNVITELPFTVPQVVCLLVIPVVLLAVSLPSTCLTLYVISSLFGFC